MGHATSYMICATPRSGSTLLCDLLTDTKVAGRPHSFFRRQSIPEWAEEFGVPTGEWPADYAFDRAYLAAVRRYGTAGTGAFGLRLMWESLEDLSRRLDGFFPGLGSDSARLQAAFGTSVYLYLSRKDKIAQAVSLLKAEQSLLWHINADGSDRERFEGGQTPAYDRVHLTELLNELETDDAAWEAWFAQEGIQPVRTTYEELTAEPRSTLARLLSALGRNPAIARNAAPRTAKLADDESREWIARFRADRAEMPARRR